MLHASEAMETSSAGNTEHELKEQGFTVVQKVRKASKPKVRGRNLKVVILDLLEGVDRVEAMKEMRLILSDKTNLRIHGMAKLQRGGVSLRFGSEKAGEIAREVLTKELESKLQKKRVYGKSKATYQVKVTGAPRGIVWEKAGVAGLKSARMVRAGVVLNMGTVEHARKAVQNGVEVGDMWFSCIPYVSAPRVACRNCGYESCKGCEKRHCFECGASDHLSSACDPKTKAEEKICVFCGTMGHNSRSCTRRRAVAGEASTAKRQTYMNVLMGRQDVQEEKRAPVERRPKVKATGRSASPMGELVFTTIVETVVGEVLKEMEMEVGSKVVDKIVQAVLRKMKKQKESSALLPEDNSSPEVVEAKMELDIVEANSTEANSSEPGAKEREVMVPAELGIAPKKKRKVSQSCLGTRMALAAHPGLVCDCGKAWNSNPGWVNHSAKNASHIIKCQRCPWTLKSTEYLRDTVVQHTKLCLG